ncbi:hypothetical protein HN51_016015 [Arachis hypogaea]|uniref:HhH-GPD domain-containing protein n=1 Tax=Arachis hypogaea TaxID=3818 RepID=A0A445CQ71_ARAHY|nr:transcriptional activator DEMETER isoform X1 [Arachis hypogaea]QHO46493.1 Transcriptional activator DEMETER [Arachis hypogaea]QHO46494.1 Transcriptional activator DEMETER [Arachis hypogaea]RYR53091.1 hypothetical protein Ahy_A06g027986 isoform A [Arachis hypogaea]
MEVGEIDRNKVQGEVPWIPNTPSKPILQRPPPIYAPGEGIEIGSHSNAVSACCESSTNAEIDTRQHLRLPHEAAVTNIACDSDKTSARLSFDNNSVSGNNGFAELLAQANPSSATYIAAYADFLRNHFVPNLNTEINPTCALLGQGHLSYEQPLFNATHNCQDPRGSSFFTYYRHNTPYAAPHGPDNAVRTENTQYAETQLHMEKKDQGREENKVSDAEHNNNDSPQNKELCDPLIEFGAVSTQCQENQSQNKEINPHINLNKTPQQKPRRKKHRPKVIIEGKPRRNSKTKTPKSDQSKDSSTSKRKYVRKKGSNTTSTPQIEVTGELTNPLMPESAKKTCRRSLNFDVGDQQRRRNSRCIEDTNINLGRETVAATNTLTNEGRQALGTPLSESNSCWAKPHANSIENGNKRKGPQDENRNRAQILSSSDTRISTTSLQAVGSKRKHTGTIKHEDTNSINLIGVQYNMLQAHYQESWIQFPNIQKKRRSEKGKNSNTSSASATKIVEVAVCPQDARSSPYASTSNFWPTSSEYNAVKVPVMITATERVIHDKPQSFRCNLSLWQTRQTKRRSKLPTRKTSVNAEREQTCIDALVADMGATLKKKKRTKKRSTLVSSAYSCTSEVQQHQKVMLENCSLPLNNLLVVGSEETWKNVHSADELTEQFRHLNINRESRELLLHGQNALVPYNQQHQKHKGPANGYGTIIPYEGSFDLIKKQRPRPKVDLDEETNRVWKLLLLDINSPGIDGMDEDKAKWWEEERKVFRGRADSFIARMHLVQGDRRFSKWKGSVVDSVVGVFLTQNVSDHLSSSAFMSLAARFPLKSSNKYQTYSEGSTSLLVNRPQPEVYIVEPEESSQKVLNPCAYDLSSMTIESTEHSEGKEVVDSNDSCRTNGSLTSSTDESNFKLSESTQKHMRDNHCPLESGPVGATIGEAQEILCIGSVSKELSDMVSSQCSVITSQICAECSVEQSPEKIGSCSESNSEVEELSNAAKYNIFHDRTSFSKLLEMASLTTLHEVNSQTSKSTENSRDASGQSIGIKHGNQTEKLNVTQDFPEASIITCNEYSLKMTPKGGVLEAGPFEIEDLSTDFRKNKEENDMKGPGVQASESETQAAIAHSQCMLSQFHSQQQSNHKEKNALHVLEETQDPIQKPRELDCGHKSNTVKEHTKIASTKSTKSRVHLKDKKDNFDWDSLRRQAQDKAGKREKTENTMDSLDWDAVRRADVREIADAIKERGMNNMLAERIKNFLNLLVDKHGAIDLEWLRDVPPDQAKEYLLNIRGLGLKSVECVRLLTLHNLAFPVDTNVGRIAVRLGWVPLQPLPESLQLHLLELYPVLESIQKYLWPRLCKLDQRTLYELHYQLITFGKVFCTKYKPNCNACPMRGECRHFASAFASARLALPGPEQKNIVIKNGNNATYQNLSVTINQLPLPLPTNTSQAEELQEIQASKQLEARSEINICQPIIEEPSTPEPECTQVLGNDIEDAFCEETCEIPAINVDMEELTLNVQNYMEENMDLQEGEMSKALVALTPEAACIPTPKLKNVNRLRTEHWVYELPDSHRLLEGWEKREPDDPGKYLLAIWTPGETANSTQPPEKKCSFQDCGQLCNEKECFQCNSFREANSQIVRGTILIPCRTAMRGSFPLNGTYFQVNEVFADDESSLNPISVPRSWIWNLRRRTVYFGTSIPTIFRGLTTQEIQRCFWRGYVCVRGFDREKRAPRPLKARLHFPASKLEKKKPSAPANTPEELNLNLEPNPEQPELLANTPNH